jgi:hypothetical protein
MRERDITAAELEAHIVVPEDTRFGLAPEAARRLYAQETAAGVPTAIAIHPRASYKWYVIQTSGQGPRIIWDDFTPECDRELLAKIYEEGFIAGRVAPSDFTLGDHENPYREGWYPATGKQKELTDQLLRVLDVAVPAGLRLACLRARGMDPAIGSTSQCGECEICRLRAVIVPMTQWVKLGFR